MIDKPRDATDLADCVSELEDLAELPFQVSCLSQKLSQPYIKGSFVQ